MRLHVFAVLAGCSLCLLFAQAAPPPKPDLLPPLVGAVSGATTDFGDLRWQGGGPNLIQNGSFDEPLEKGWEPSVLFGGSWHRTNRAVGPAVYSNSPVVFRRLVQTRPQEFLWRAELVQALTLPQSSSLVLSWDDLTGPVTSARDIYQLEVRDADDCLLFIGLKVPYQTGQRWTRRSVELTPWAGRKVRLAWVLSNFEFHGDLLALDNVRLEATPTDGTTFDVFFGPRTTFAPTNLIARTTGLTATPPATRNGVSNYWRVVAVRNGETNASVNGVFQRPQIGARQLYLGDTNRVPPVVNELRPLQVLLRTDPTLPTATVADFDLILMAEDAIRPTVLLSEIRFGPAGGIELMNVTDGEQDISGWRVAWTDERGRGQRVVNIPEHVSLAAGETLVLRGNAALGEGGAEPFPKLTMNQPFWPSQPTNAVIVLAGPAPVGPNARRPVKDCLLAGDARWLSLSTGEDGYFYVLQHDLPETEWPQVGVGMVPGATGLRRILRRDSNSAGDWRPTYGAGEDWGFANPELIGPWRNGPGALVVSNQPSTAIVSGRWSGQTKPLQEGRNAFFRAFQPLGQGGFDTVFSSVAWPRLQVWEPNTVEVLLPASVAEGTAGLGKVELAEPSKTNVVLRLSAEPSGRLSLPESVVIPAGQRSAEFTLSVPQELAFQGTVTVRVNALGGAWKSPGAETLVIDDEVAALHLDLPPVLTEGVAADGFIRIPTASAYPVTVFLRTSETQLRVPASVVIPAGAVEASFQIQRFSDPFLESPRTAVVSAQLGIQPAVAASLSLPDDESPKISFANLNEGTAAKPLMEGAVAPLKGKVRLGGYSHTNVSVRLTSARPDRLQLRAPDGTAVNSLTVVVDRTATEAAFEVLALNNDLQDGRQTVTLRAEAAGLEPGALELVIADNDPARLAIFSPPSPQHQGVPFQFSWRALNVDGENVPAPVPPIRYTRHLLGPDGRELSSDESSFELFGEVMAANETFIQFLPATGARVRIEAAGLTADSPPFNILPAPVTWTALTNLLAFTVDESRGEVVALVGRWNDAEPAHIVRINPEQQSITRIASAPVAVGQNVAPLVELSADGRYIFTVGGEPDRFLWVFRTSDGQLVEQRNLAAVGALWQLASRRPPAGAEWSVCAVATGPKLVFFDSHRDVPMMPPNYVGALVGDPDRQKLFAWFYAPEGRKLAELLPTGGGGVDFRSVDWDFRQDFDLYRNQFQYRDGRLFSAFGETFDLNSRHATSGLFASQATTFSVDPVRRELLLAGPGNISGLTGAWPIWSMYSLDSRKVTGTTVFPLDVFAGRIEWVSRDWLALEDGWPFPNTRSLKFLALPLVRPNTNTADLRIAVESPAPPFKVGQDYRWRVTVTNAGPQAATDVRLRLGTQSWPWWISPTDPEGIGFEGSPPDRHWFGLAAGESHTFDMVLRPYGSGSLTLQFLASANETDPRPENNDDTRTTVVELAVSPPELPVADVQVTARIVSPPLRQGDPLTMLLTVTNRGPEIATNVVCAVLYEDRMTALKGVPSSHVPGKLQWTVPTLAPGETRSFTALLRCDTSGSVPVTANAGNTSAFKDPDLANNEHTVSMLVGFPAGGTPRIFGRFVDAVFDAPRNRLWVSGHPNSIAWPDKLVALDLESGQPVYTLQPGPSPGLLALTDDGSHLWVETEQGARLHRINLETGNVDFAFGTDEKPPFQEFIHVTALLPLLGDNDAIGLVRIRNGEARFQTFRAGRPEYPVLPLEGAYASIAPEGSLIATLDPDGSLVAGQRGTYRIARWVRKVAGYEFSSAADLGGRDLAGVGEGIFVLSDGSALNPRTLTVNPIDAQLATVVTTATVERQRSWLWVGKPGSNSHEWELQWRDLSTGLVLGSTNLVGEIAAEILPIGGQRIVTRHEDHLDIRRLAMLPADLPTDLALSVRSHLQGDGKTAVFEFTVENRGTNLANNLKVEYATTSTPGNSSGTFSRAALEFGDLPPGQVRNQSISLPGAWSGLEITASAVVHSAAQEAYPPDNFDRASTVAPWVFEPLASSDFHGNALLWSPTAFRIVTLMSWGVTEVVQLDPRTGVYSRRTSLGAVHDLAVSPAGEWLFAITHPENVVQRLRLPEMDERITVPVAAGIEEAAPPQAAKVCGLTDRSGGFAVLLQDGRVRIFDGRTPRRWLSSPDSPLAANAMLLATQDRVVTLNGTILRSLVTSAEGITAEIQRELPEAPLNLCRAGELLVLSTGDVLRARDLEQVAHLPARGWVAADSLSETVTFLASVPEAGRFELRQLRLNSGETIASVHLPDSGNLQPAGLVRWGANGFAALTGDIFGRFTAQLGQFAPSAIAPERDSDADGIPDVVELDHGLSPLESDLVADVDGDGFSNAAELAAGTDFRSAVSPLRLGFEPGSVAGVLKVRFSTDSHRRFVLETAPALGGPWTELGHPIVGDGGFKTLEVPTGGAPVFVRLQTNR